MVEVFKTNVQQDTDAQMLIEKLGAHFPQHRFNFDLSDCDKILRMEGEEIESEAVIRVMALANYDCTVLEN